MAGMFLQSSTFSFFFLKKQLYRFNPLIELSAMQKTVSFWKWGKKGRRDTFLLFYVELFRLITNNLCRVFQPPESKRSSDDTHHATKYTPANRQMTNLGKTIEIPVLPRSQIHGGRTGMYPAQC